MAMTISLGPKDTSRQASHSEDCHGYKTEDVGKDKLLIDRQVEPGVIWEQRRVLALRGQEESKNAHNCRHTRDIVWRLPFCNKYVFKMRVPRVTPGYVSRFKNYKDKMVSSPLPPCMLSWASACALAPKLCSTPKLFLVSLPKLDDSASGAPGWSVARMSFLPRIWRTIEAQFENLRILGGNETSWKPLEFRPQTCVSGTCQLFHRFAGRQQHAWNVAFKMKHETNLFVFYVSR